MHLAVPRQIGGNQAFSTDISGEVKWWAIPSGALPGGPATEAPALRAIMRSPFKAVVSSVDYCATSGLVFCGDQKGNIVGFNFLDRGGAGEPLAAAVTLKHQHGLEAVSFLACGGGGEVVSGGRDGKVFTYEARPPRPTGGARCGHPLSISLSLSLAPTMASEPTPLTRGLAFAVP